jgi:hypothetical protein
MIGQFEKQEIERLAQEMGTKVPWGIPTEVTWLPIMQKMLERIQVLESIVDYLETGIKLARAGRHQQHYQHEGRK